jgi:hypothetical protein
MADPAVTPEATKPVPGSPEHDAAMAAKFDAQQAGIGATPAADAPVKPEHVPEKFWDATTGQVNYEAWSKSTTEAERRITELSTGKTTPADQKPAGDTTPAADTPEAKAAQEALSAKGMDLGEFSKEFSEKGALSDESYEKLVKSGFSRDLVDSFIAGQVALANQRDSVGYQEAGGKDKFVQMAEWSKTNMTDAERASFNKAMTGTVEDMKLAIGGLKARYQAAEGSDPALIGGKGGDGGTAAFASRAEMTAAIKDPRYAKDPAYRAVVEKRIGAMTNY